MSVRVRAGVQLAFGSVKGPVRPTNEDEFLVFEPSKAEELTEQGRLLIVADGVGGGPAGAQASHVALRHFLAGFLEEGGGPALRLASGVRRANSAIAAEVRRRPTLEGMATTLTAVCLRGTRLEGVQLGDTVCLLGREGQWTPLSPMHRAATSSRITRAVGAGGERARPEPFEADLLAGDLIVLATDGIWDGLGEERVFALLRGASPERAVGRLLEAAQSMPSGDNATVVVIRVPEPRVDAGESFQEIREISPVAPLPGAAVELGAGWWVRAVPWLLIGAGVLLLVAWGVGLLGE